jgi:hypothetical protein
MPSASAPATRRSESSKLRARIASTPTSSANRAVQDDETPAWAGYEGPEQQMFRRGEEALAAARRAGVFSIGMWVAVKPGAGTGAGAPIA